MIVNVPDDAPAAMVAVPGVADALSEVTVTVKPAAGAGEVIVIVPVELTPPTTVVGFKVKALTVGP